MPKTLRSGRLNEEIMREVSEIVKNGMKDPRISQMTSVLRAEVTRDLSFAKVYVSVSNTGDTIPPEELPLVFDRFHKIDKSRSLNRDGWGLGLYIVKTIICSHGEDISVTSRDGKTEFTFTLAGVNSL